MSSSQRHINHRKELNMATIKSRKHANSFNHHINATLAAMLLPVAAHAGNPPPDVEQSRPAGSDRERHRGKRLQGRQGIVAEVHRKAGQHGADDHRHQEGTDRAARRGNADRSAAQHARRRHLLPRRERQHQHRRLDLHARLRLLDQHLRRRRARHRFGLARRLQHRTDRRAERPGRHRQRPRRADRLGQPGVEAGVDGRRGFRHASRPAAAAQSASPRT